MVLSLLDSPSAQLHLQGGRGQQCQYGRTDEGPWYDAWELLVVVCLQVRTVVQHVVCGLQGQALLNLCERGEHDVQQHDDQKKTPRKT